MSLQVWLTGNNTMRNQGLLGDLTETTSPSYVDGKLGKAMSTGAYKMTAEQTAQVLNNEAISICFWVYINAATGTTSGGNLFFGNYSMEANNNRKFSLFNYPSVNDLHWSWMNDTANTTFTNGVLSGVLPSYQWTHVAITYQNPNGTIYINGEKVHTFTGVSNSSTFAYETQVIHNYDYLYWNDYRIYNECISAKTVKEISKGLVCHYKLSSQYETGQANKYFGDVAEGYLNCSSTFTRTKLENERGYNYKFSYTGNGNNRWDSMNAGTFSFTPGKRYFYSCKVRCHSRNFNMAFRASRSDNDWVTNMVHVLNPDGEWHEYYVAQTINSTYDRSGSTVTCNPTLEFYTDGLATSGKVYTADFDIKDIQVIESDCYVPFIDNSMTSTVVSDCSGFGNNGTKVGDIAWSGDSARYSGSYYLGTETATYINTPNFNFENMQQGTVSLWINRHSTNSNWRNYLLFANAYNWTGVEHDFIIFGSTGTNAIVMDCCSNTYDFIPDLNKWYLYTISWDLVSHTTKMYVNGELKKTITNSKIDTTYASKHNYHFIGNALYSESDYSLSDFRLYSICLSDEDVKSLYNTSASIDKTCVLTAYEFVESEEV